MGQWEKRKDRSREEKIGTMTGKGREPADMMERRQVEGKQGQTQRGRSNLFYQGGDRKLNAVEELLRQEHVNSVPKGPQDLSGHVQYQSEVWTHSPMGTWQEMGAT